MSRLASEVGSNGEKDVSITDIKTHLVRSPRMATSTNVYRDEAFIVEVVSDAGVSGWGEANGLLPALDAFVNADRPHPRDRGPRHALIGQNLSDLDGLLSRLRDNTILSGRSGLGRVAIGAIETALFDLFGKVTDHPAWRLLSGTTDDAAQTAIAPYITIYNRGSYSEVLAKGRADIDRALDYGYRAFKVEATDYNTSADDAITLVEDMREHVGDGVILFVDNVYRWKEYESALKAAKRYAELNIEFLEDPFFPEQWELCRRLYEEVGIPLATGGGMETRERFVASMELGKTAIVQPGVHVAGFLGAHEVAQAARERNREVTTFSVCATSLAVAGSVNLAAANENVSYVEYAPAQLFPELLLRAEIAGPEPELSNGIFLAPTSPGIGAECYPDALDKYRVVR